MKNILVGFFAILVIVSVLLLFYFKSDTQNPYERVQWGRFSGNCSTVEIPSEDFGRQIPPCDDQVPESEIPSFLEVGLPFVHQFDNKKSLPVMASCVIDVDGDGKEELFLGGGYNQADALFAYREGAFVEMTESYEMPAKPEASTTYGAVSFDLDENGHVDLLLSGTYGLRCLKNNGQSFEALDIPVPLNDKSTALTTTLGDFDRDGDVDIFLSTYIDLDKMEGQTIFNDPEYGSNSLLLQNNGDLSFSDVTKQLGLSYTHNTFQAVFVDVDQDRWLDLVVAYDTGEARCYKNEQGSGFRNVKTPMSGKYAYPMGIAVGDYNNDNQIDFFFSNTGSSVPEFLARGDLREDQEFNPKWMLWRNEGDFNLVDVAEHTRVADFEFSWGALFEDFNLDSRQDLVVAENYVDFPPHRLFKLPCRFLVQRPDKSFSAVEEQAGVVNRHYAISPITADFDQDGYPDLVYSNLNGKSRAFINEGGENNYIAFRFPESAAYAGTTVFVSSEDGSNLSDAYVIGEGLGSDQSSTVRIGLGKQEKVNAVLFRFPDGKTQLISGPETGKVHLVNR